MNIILGPLLTVIIIALDLYFWFIIISAILSWLVHFGVVNTRNQFINMVGTFLWKITEPALRPLRRVIPVFGGIDISPIVLILIIIFLQQMLFNLRMEIMQG